MARLQLPSGVWVTTNDKGDIIQSDSPSVPTVSSSYSPPSPPQQPSPIPAIVPTPAAPQISDAQYQSIRQMVSTGQLQPGQAVEELKKQISQGQYSGTVDTAKLFPTNFSYTGADGATYQIGSDLKPIRISAAIQQTVVTPQGIATGIPSVPLQQGSIDKEAIKTLQNYLMSQNLLTQEQINTGPGVYGPQTAAAILALQKKLNVVEKGFGPKTIAAISKPVPTPMPAPVDNPQKTFTTPNGAVVDEQGNIITPATTQQTEEDRKAKAIADAKLLLQSEGLSVSDGASNLALTNPVKFVTDLYGSLYSTAGLGTLKTEYETFIKHKEDITNEMNDKIVDVNDNPWLSEAARASQVASVQSRYSGKLDSATNSATLLKGLYDTGLQSIQATTGHILTAYNAAANIAEKQYELAFNAAVTLEEARIKSAAPDYKGVKEVNGGLYDMTTNKWIVQPKPSSTGAGLTPGQIFSGTLTVGSKVDTLNKSANIIITQSTNASEALKRYKSGEAKDLNATSQAIIISFNKMLDPTSVVRESEYDRSAAGQALLSTIGGKVAALARGGPGLTVASLQEVVDLGNVYAKNAKESIDAEKARAVAFGKKYGLDADYIGGGYVRPINDAPAVVPAVVPVATSPETINYQGTNYYVDINGEMTPVPVATGDYTPSGMFGDYQNPFGDLFQ